jgi:hypothetical protein
LPEHKKIHIYPFSDFHLGDKHFDEKKLRGYLKIVAEVPEAYCLFDGDLINVGLPNGVGAADFWDQKPIKAQEQHEALCGLIREYDITEKILAIVGGSNHPARAMKLTGHNYDKQFAIDLGLKHLYMEPVGMLFLGIGSRATNTLTHHKGSSIWYTILITHGTAGGKLAGSAINATRGIGAVYSADVFITAHRHLDAVTRDEFYIPDYHNKSITKIRRLYVNAGTFLGYSGYAQGKCLQPNGTGTPRIYLSGEKKDCHASV